MGRVKFVNIVALIWGLALVSLAGIAHAQTEPASPPIVVTTPVALPTVTPTSSSPPAIRIEYGGDAAAPYIVKAGDTLLTVAIETGLDLDDAPCLIAPDFRLDQPLVVGDELDVLPSEIVCHAVENGETLTGIATRYASTPAAVRAIAWNQWPAGVSEIAVLPAGGYLRVPRGPEPKVTINLDFSDEAGFIPLMLRQPVGASPFTLFAVSAAMAAAGAPPVGGPRVPDNAPQMAPVPADWPFGSGYFAWPLYGWLSQGFHGDHRAVDVAAPTGTLVTAADRGVVTRAGWNNQGYGNFVVIDHNIDYVTLYGHLSEVLVAAGDVVAQGQPIGIVGTTGNSTGPHLHFEIRDFGRRIDPIGLLVR